MSSGYFGKLKFASFTWDICLIANLLPCTWNVWFVRETMIFVSFCKGWRCKRYGHRTGDRECPFFITGNQKLEHFRVVSLFTAVVIVIVGPPTVPCSRKMRECSRKKLVVAFMSWSYDRDSLCLRLKLSKVTFSLHMWAADLCTQLVPVYF